MAHGGARRRVEEWLRGGDAPPPRARFLLHVYRLGDLLEVEAGRVFGWDLDTPAGLVNLFAAPLWCVPPRGALRRRVVRVVHHRHFGSFILACILLNSVIECVDAAYADAAGWVGALHGATDVAFVTIFAVEAVLKILAYGFVLHSRAYLRSGWNALDFFVLVASVVALAMASEARSPVMQVRVVRVLRPLRTFRSVPGLANLITAIVQALPMLIDACLMTSLVVLIFAVLGLQLWKGDLDYRCYAYPLPNASDASPYAPMYGDRGYFLYQTDNDRPCGWRRCPDDPLFDVRCEKHTDLFKAASSYDHLGYAMVEAVRVVTLDDWHVEMFYTQDAHTGSVAWLYFTLLTLVGGYLLLSLVVSVLSVSLSEASNYLHVVCSRVVPPDVIGTAPMTATLYNYNRPKNSMPYQHNGHYVRKSGGPAAAAADKTVEKTMVQYFGQHRYLAEYRNDYAAQVQKQKDEEDHAQRVAELREVVEDCEQLAASLAKEVRAIPSTLRADTLLGLDVFQYLAAIACPRIIIPVYDVPNLETTAAASTASDVSSQHPARRTVRLVVEGKAFQYCMLAITATSVVALATDHHGISETHEGWIRLISNLCVGCFAAEAALKIAVMGPRRYAADRWNVLDFGIVLVSLPDLLTEYSGGVGAVFRAFRAFRLVGAMSVSQREMVDALGHALPDLASILLLVGIVVFMFGLLGEDLYGEVRAAGVRENFRTLWEAFATAFVLVLHDGWNRIARAYGDATSGYALVYFLAVFFFGRVIAVSLFSAVLLDRLRDQLRLRRRTAQKHALRELKSLGICASSNPVWLTPALLAQQQELTATVDYLQRAHRDAHRATPPPPPPAAGADPHRLVAQRLPLAVHHNYTARQAWGARPAHPRVDVRIPVHTPPPLQQATVTGTLGFWRAELAPQHGQVFWVNALTGEKTWYNPLAAKARLAAGGGAQDGVPRGIDVGDAVEVWVSGVWASATVLGRRDGGEYTLLHHADGTVQVGVHRALLRDPPAAPPVLRDLPLELRRVAERLLAQGTGWMPDPPPQHVQRAGGHETDDAASHRAAAAEPIANPLAAIFPPTRKHAAEDPAPPAPCVLWAAAGIDRDVLEAVYTRPLIECYNHPALGGLMLMWCALSDKAKRRLEAVWDCLPARGALLEHLMADGTLDRTPQPLHDEEQNPVDVYLEHVAGGDANAIEQHRVIYKFGDHSGLGGAAIHAADAARWGNRLAQGRTVLLHKRARHDAAVRLTPRGDGAAPGNVSVGQFVFSGSDAASVEHVHRVRNRRGLASNYAASSPTSRQGSPQGGDAQGQDARERARLHPNAEGFMPPTLSTVDRILLTLDENDTLSNRACGVFPKDCTFRRRLYVAAAHPYSEGFFLVVTLGNAVILGLDDRYAETRRGGRAALRIATGGCVALFLAETAMKAVAQGLWRAEGACLRDPWNVLDVVVAVSQGLWAAGVPYAGVLRGLRVVRLALWHPPVKTLCEMLFGVLPDLLKTAWVYLILWIVFGVTGVALFKGELFGCNDVTRSTEADCVGSYWVVVGSAIQADATAAFPRVWARESRNFDHLGQAFLSLFHLHGGEEWARLMWRTVDAAGVAVGPQRNAHPWRALYFVLFMILGFAVLSALLTAILVNGFLSVHHNALQTLSTRQRRWMRMQALVTRHQLEWRHRVPHAQEWGGLRLLCFRVWSDTKFDVVIYTLIVLNFALIATDHEGIEDSHARVIHVGNVVFVVVFVLEAMVKIAAVGAAGYFGERWNRYDFFCVVLSLVGLLMGLNTTVVRVARVIRGVRLVKKAERLRQLEQTLYRALPTLLHASVLLLVLFYNYGLVGVDLYKHLPPHSHVSFDTLPHAALVLYQLATREGRPYLLRQVGTYPPECDPNEGGCGERLADVLYFGSAAAVGGFLLLNLAVYLVLECYIEVRREYFGMRSEEFAETFRAFVELWTEADHARRRKIGVDEFLAIAETLPTPFWTHGIGRTGWLTLLKNVRALPVPITADREVSFENCMMALALKAVGIKRHDASAAIDASVLQRVQRFLDPSLFTIEHALGVRRIEHFFELWRNRRTEQVDEQARKAQLEEILRLHRKAEEAEAEAEAEKEKGKDEECHDTHPPATEATPSPPHSPPRPARRLRWGGAARANPAHVSPEGGKPAQP